MNCYRIHTPEGDLYVFATHPAMALYTLESYFCDDSVPEEGLAEVLGLGVESVAGDFLHRVPPDEVITIPEWTLPCGALEYTIRHEALTDSTLTVCAKADAWAKVVGDAPTIFDCRMG